MGNPEGAYVYIAFRPDTGQPLYVGKGTGERYKAHKRRNTHFGNIVRKYNGSVPIIIIRSGLSSEEALIIEEAFIRAIGIERDGGPLINQGYGGYGGPVGIVHNSEWRAIRSQRAKELWQIPEYRAKMLRPDRGRSGNKQPRSAEWRANISKGLIGNKRTLGYKHADSAREKLRVSVSGSKWINNGEINRRIDADTILPVGWVYGKILSEKALAQLARARIKLAANRAQKEHDLKSGPENTGLYQSSMRAWVDE